MTVCHDCINTSNKNILYIIVLRALGIPAHGAWGGRNTRALLIMMGTPTQTVGAANGAAVLLLGVAMGFFTHAEFTRALLSSCRPLPWLHFPLQTHLLISAHRL